MMQNIQKVALYWGLAFSIHNSLCVGENLGTGAAQIVSDAGIEMANALSDGGVEMTRLCEPNLKSV